MPEFAIKFRQNSERIAELAEPNLQGQVIPVPFSIVPFIFLVIPILEIAAFIVVGSKIGVLPTLALVFVTAAIGSILLRIQGFGLIERIRREMDAGRVPGRELVHGVMLIVAAILLITPGFITDTLGFLLFVPAFRDLGWRFLRKRIVVVGSTQSAQGFSHTRQDSRYGPVVDLDEDEFSEDAEPDSPWRLEDDRRPRK